MNDDHRASESQNLEPPLKAAVQAVLAEPVPDDAVRRMKERAQRLALTTLPPARALDAPTRHWKVSRSLMGSLTAAAAIAAVAIGVALLSDRSGGQAFAQVIERIKAASTVRFSTSYQFGQQPAQTGQMLLEGNRLRHEQFNGALVSVADFDRQQAVVMDVPGQRAQTIDLQAQALREFVNPIDQLRQAKSDDAESIGEQQLGGRRVRVYRLSKVDLLGIKGAAETTVWVDVESDLPAKIVIRDVDPKHRTEFRFESFVWNEPLDAHLFSLEIPEGYQRDVVVISPEAQDTNAEKTSAGPQLVDGVLHDRAPAQIIWGPAGATITALMRDPESTPTTSGRPKELRQWDLATGQIRWSEPIPGVGAVASTADGTLLATVIGFEVQLRDAATGQVIRTWVTDEPLAPLAFSPDGQTLAAGIAEWGPYGGRGGAKAGGVQFWNVDQGALVRTVPDDQPTTFVRYSPDGQLLATGSNEGSVKLWNPATGALVRIFPGSHADFSPDGQTIACTSIPSRPGQTIGTVDLYTIVDGALIKTLASEPAATASSLLGVVFSPDGARLAAADWNGTATVWNVGSGEREQTIRSHDAGVLAVAFAPDGAWLATGGEDQTLRVTTLPAASVQPPGSEQ